MVSSSWRGGAARGGVWAVVGGARDEKGAAGAVGGGA